MSRDLPYWCELTSAVCGAHEVVMKLPGRNRQDIGTKPSNARPYGRRHKTDLVLRSRWESPLGLSGHFQSESVVELDGNLAYLPAHPCLPALPTAGHLTILQTRRKYS